MDEQSLTALEFHRLLRKLSALAECDEAREKLSRLSPLRTIVEVREELIRVEEVRDLIARGSGYPGSGTNDVRLLLRKAAVSGSTLESEELLTLLHQLRIYSFTRKLLDRERRLIPHLFNLTKSLLSLPDLETAIERVISPEGTVRDSASPELARLRRSISVQMDVLRTRLNSIIPRLAKQGVLREESFSLRDGRYVLPVRSDAMGNVKGIVHDRSSTGGTLFVEPSALIDLGNELRTLELAERDEVRRILKEVTAVVRLNIEQISANISAMVNLDLLWAKARFSDQLDAITPELTDSGTLKILGGRHPLLALDEGRNVVPLTLEIGVDYGILVISGPNAGGKSVALKCVGLLCLMAGCGLPVPALPGTELTLFDDIIADIGDQQSISDDLSTFTAHTRRLKEILDCVATRALVLIDEIGAGTDPQEGASLSVAVLEKLCRKRVPTIVTTHSGALKAFAHSTEWCANGSMEFDAVTFKPTYRFRPHIPGSSYALDIARRTGLPDEIVNRAKELLGSEQTRLEDLIVSLSERMSRYDTMLIDEKQRRELTVAQETAMQQKLDKLQRRERELKQRAAQELEELLKSARKTIEATVRELREKNADKLTIATARKVLDELRAKAKLELELPVIDVPQPASRSPKPEPIADKSPEIGDWVKIDDSAVGTVTALSARGERLCVAVGSVHLWVTRPRVTVIEPPEQSVPVSKYVHLPEVPFELDVRGLDAPEALERVERYIYDGYMTGRHKLGIIHGKGMGILARHIQKHLKKHSLVSSFRFGEYGEGDYGVTIVELKT